ncbi:hypothetical protein QYR09_09340 [Cellulophaga lytica]|nr:hypothetical protein QYR09_09340 [Cellulophaga lytica]
MKKYSIKLLFLTLILVYISCKDAIENVLELDEDYKVIELEYGFDNYLKNIQDSSEEIIIKQRNIVIINVDEDGNTNIEKSKVADSLIITELKKYIVPNPENKEMPETSKKTFEYSGKVDINANIIVLGIFDKKLNYEKYREIRNKIYIAFNEVRNEFSLRKFDKPLLELIKSTETDDITIWQEIRQIFPIRYMETVAEK